MASTWNDRSSHPTSAACWRLLAIVLAAASVACLASAVAAQQPDVTVELDREELYTGESARYSITLSNFDNPKPPNLSAWTDLDVEYLGEQSSNFSSTTIINGRMTRSERRGQTYQYRLTPRRHGELTLPAPQVENNGQMVYGRALRLTVKAPEPQDLAIVEIVSDRDQVYPLQPIQVMVKVLLKSLPEPYEDVAPLRVVRGDPPHLNLPWIGNDSFAAGVNPSEDWKDWLQDLVQEAGFNINGVRLSGGSPLGMFDQRQAAFAPESQRVQREDLQGQAQTYWEYVFTAEFTAENLGQVRFGPVTLDGTLAVAGSTSGRMTGRRVYAVAPAIEVLVKQPPEEGRPDCYIGAIGEFDVRSELAPLQARVGDPLTLTLTLEGRGALREARPLDLSKQAGLDSKFKVYSGSARVDGQRWEATYSLRPLSEEVREFPELQVAYFDVAKEQYVIHALAPIPLEVSPADEITELDVQGGSSPEKATPTISPGEDGLFASITDPRHVRVDRWGVVEAATITLGAAATFLAALSWVGLSRGSEQRRQVRRRRKAPSRARKWIQAARDSLERGELEPAALLLRQAITELPGAAIRTETAQWSPSDLRRRVFEATRSEELADLGERLLVASDAARFGRDAASLRLAVEQAPEWCHDVDQLLPK